MAETPSQDFFNPIAYEQLQKIMEQMTKNVCSIYINNEKTEIGKGFFCKIPISGKTILPALVINKQIINEHFIK